MVGSGVGVTEDWAEFLMARAGRWVVRLAQVRVPSAVAGVVANVADRFWPLAFARRLLVELAEPEPEPAPVDFELSPAGFPSDVPLFRTSFERFDGSQLLPGQWRAIPCDEAQLVALAVWAQKNGKKLRPLGAAHSWSPMMAAGDIALDMRRFRGIAVNGVTQRATFGAGVTLEQASRAMEAHGCMFADVPAIGEATVAGAAAMGTHGTGFTHPGGTLSAGIVEIRALVFDPSPKFVTYTEADPEFEFLTMHLGSLLVTEVTFKAIDAKHFQLVARNTPALQYFAGRGTTGLFADLRDKRAVELMWFADQGRPLAKQRLLHRAWHRIPRADFVVRRPYSELFVNFATRATDQAVRATLRADGLRRGIGPNLHRFFRIAAWRDHKQSPQAAQLYSSGFILRFRAAGWCLVCARDKVPALLEMLARELYDRQRRWEHAWTGPVEVRMTCVDPPSYPLLSAARSSDPKAVAVWVNLLAERDDETGKRMREVELFLLSLAPTHVTNVRGEWSKAFAFDENGQPWRDTKSMAQLVDGAAVAKAKAIRARLDPHAVFASPLARLLL